MTSPAEFMAAASPAPMMGNTRWASDYANELRSVVTEHSRNSARNLQKRLGPSELGSPCDRQVVGKMAGCAPTNHVFDPWPSIVGTAVHAWLADAFQTANNGRWVTEQRVPCHPNHSGTADLYDAHWQAVVDHKCLGETPMPKLKRNGPPRKYRVQLLLYGQGYRHLGLPVERVALMAWPRTKSSLDTMYCWETPFDTEAEQLLAEVFEQTRERTALAELVAKGYVGIMDVPATPDDDECFYCPLYRPQSAHDGGPGCPGTITNDNGKNTP